MAFELLVVAKMIGFGLLSEYSETYLLWIASVKRCVPLPESN